MTKKFDRHEAGRSLDEKKRYLLFQLGSQIQSIKTHQFGFLFDANYAHQMALWALEATGWNSIKSAKAILSVGGMI